MHPPDPSLHIRRARPSDSPALSRICLLTADAGTSAEAQHNIPELPGLFFACPYVHVPYTSGFVLVRRRVRQTPPADSGSEEKSKEEDDEGVVGYVLFAFDTRAFEAAAERSWFPPLRVKYPKLSEGVSSSAYDILLTDADKRYISLMHASGVASDACIAFSPVHLHINILPEAQRQGWGRRLIDSAVRYLRDEKGLASLWLGIDSRNTDAARFYERLGFSPIEGAPSSLMGLKFENWTLN